MPANSRKIHNQHWEEVSEIINRIKQEGPVSRHLLRILNHLLIGLQYKSVLDVGCGQGIRLAQITVSSSKTKCFGVDISDNAVNQAKKNYPNFAFKQLDVSKSKLRQKFDLVLMLDVIEHIKDDLQALKNINKMTNKYFILSTLQGRMRESEDVQGHVRNYRYEDLLTKLNKANFEVIKGVQWGFPFYSPVYRNILELIVKTKIYLASTQSKRLKIQDRSFAVPRYAFTIAGLLFQLMRFNSHNKGDYIFILAKPKGRQASRVN